jgi:hypothetical protein
MYFSKQVVPMVVVALAGSACYQGMDPLDLSDEITEQREAHANAIQFNGITWNGLTFNGLTFNGITFNGITFNGITFNGITFNDTHLEGSSIVVTKKWKGKKFQLRDEQLVGMDLNITVDVVDKKNKKSRADFVIRANDIYTDGIQDDVFYYDMEISLKGTNQWFPLCEGGVPAIPIANYWDEKTGKRIDNDEVVTFACTNGVLAHCVEWGYRPWADAKRCNDWQKGKKGCNKVELADYHQACTRMARADYCGTGQAWTVAGTPIDIYDHLSPQIESPETDWPVEAEWTPNGAYCLDDIRQQGWKAEGKYPKCKWPLAKEKSDCGSLKLHRAMLVSKFEPVD